MNPDAKFDHVAEALLAGTMTTFRSNKSLADKAVAQVDDRSIRVALDKETNSIAVIMKHVSGNLQSRWTDFLTADGEKSTRNRDQEFVDTFQDREEILSYWEQGWDCLFATLDQLTSDDLTKEVLIRGEPHSVPLAIQRSATHCAYHVGQIVMIARVLASGPWETLTIPRSGSQAYNVSVWGQDSFKSRAKN